MSGAADSFPDVRGRFTAIWQSKKPHQQQWVDEIFGSFIKDHVYDGDRRIVMDDAILLDQFILKTPLPYYEAFRGRGAFLINFLDENYDGGYERYQPFLGVFRMHWAAPFEGERIRPLPVGYVSGFQRSGEIKPASLRGNAWFFAGVGSKSSRPEALRALRNVKPYALRITDGFRDARLEMALGRVEPGSLIASLRDSVFAPAPMGNVNLECYRVYEALEAGAIPLIEKRLTLDYFTDLLGPHPLPTFRTWPAAAAFAQEVLGAPDRLDALQATCVQWWSDYKRRLTADAGAFMSDRLANPYASPIALETINSPLWQYRELLRHQTGRSLARRIGRQAKRLATSRRLRIAHGN